MYLKEFYDDTYSESCRWRPLHLFFLRCAIRLRIWASREETAHDGSNSLQQLNESRN